MLSKTVMAMAVLASIAAVIVAGAYFSDDDELSAEPMDPRIPDMGGPSMHAPNAPAPPMHGPDDMSRTERMVPPMDRFGPGPEPLPPRYNHDATPEEMDRLIPVMIEDDISNYDPGFVQDVIDYAAEMEMEDVAEILSKKLSDYLSALRTINCVSAIDTRASGISTDEEVSDSDPVYIEETETEVPEETVPQDLFVQLPSYSKPVCAPALLLHIQLDL